MSFAWTKNTKEMLQYLLGAILVAAEFCIVGLVLYIWYMGPRTSDPNIVNLVYALSLGYHSAFMLVIGYFFGSSKGSSDKTDVIAVKSGIKPPEA